MASKLSSQTALFKRQIVQNLYDELKPYFRETDCKLLKEQSYSWKEDDNKDRIPNLSVLCYENGRENQSYTGVPRFIADVSDSDYDKKEQMNVYSLVGVS